MATPGVGRTTCGHGMESTGATSPLPPATPRLDGTPPWRTIHPATASCCSEATTDRPTTPIHGNCAAPNGCCARRRNRRPLAAASTCRSIPTGSACTCSAAGTPAAISWEAFNDNPATFSELPGSGCPIPSSGTPLLGLTNNDPDNLAWLGGQLRVTLSDLPSGFPISLIAFGLGPAISVPLPPWPGCTLYVNPVISFVTVGSSPQTAAVDIPWDASLLGVDLVSQGVVLQDPYFGFSRGTVARIGARH